MESETEQVPRFRSWLDHQLRVREWSRADAAKRIGADPSAVSRWLSGERKPTPEMADLIAEALNVDIDFLLSLLGYRPPIFDVDPDSPEAKLIPLIRQIDWASRPGRLEEVEAEYLFMIESDRKRKRRE